MMTIDEKIERRLEELSDLDEEPLPDEKHLAFVKPFIKQIALAVGIYPGLYCEAPTEISARWTIARDGSSLNGIVVDATFYKDDIDVYVFDRKIERIVMETIFCYNDEHLAERFNTFFEGVVKQFSEVA